MRTGSETIDHCLAMEDYENNLFHGVEKQKSEERREEMLQLSHTCTSSPCVSLLTPLRRCDVV